MHHAAHTLEAHANGEVIFHSEGRWLYPLFELEAFLGAGAYEAPQLVVHDKIVGRAAALLLVRLGVGGVRAGVLSALGQEMLEEHEVPHAYEKLVERIDCRTEELLREVTDPDAAYALIRARIDA
jgi:zinc transport system ATP-binding protein